MPGVFVVTDSSCDLQTKRHPHRFGDTATSLTCRGRRGARIS